MSDSSDTPAREQTLLQVSIWALRLTWTANRRLTMGVILTSLIVSTTPALLLVALRGLIDTTVAMVAEGTGDFTPLIPWLAVGITLTLFQGLGEFGRVYNLNRLQDELHLYITSRILAHAAVLEVSFFEDPQSQDTIERVQQNTANHFSAFVTQVIGVLTGSVEAILLSLVLVRILPLVLVLFLPAVPPFLYFHWKTARAEYSEEFGRATKNRWAKYFVDNLTNHQHVPETRILGLAPLLIGRYRAVIKTFRDQNRRRHGRRFAASTLFSIYSTVAFYASFFVVAIRTVAGSLTIGDMVVFAGTTGRVRRIIESIIVTAGNTLSKVLYISNLKRFLELEPEVDRSLGDHLPQVEGTIELKQVSFSYPGADQPALRDVSLTIRAGETIALVGENGAGKTTLVKLIARFHDPEQGSILLDGIDIKSLSLEFLHSQVSFVFQDFGRYEATVSENIAYGDWNRLLEQQDEIEAIARQANVDQMILEMPDGYSTLLGRMFGTHTLSKGQWQKVAIARAFARKGALLILDEPTANLDSRAEFRLYKQFQDLAAGRTTILISHRFSTVSMADRIVVINKGQIIEEGTHEELLRKAGHYAQLYTLHLTQMSLYSNAR